MGSGKHSHCQAGLKPGASSSTRPSPGIEGWRRKAVTGRLTRAEVGRQVVTIFPDLLRSKDLRSPPHSANHPANWQTDEIVFAFSPAPAVGDWPRCREWPGR